LTCHARCVGSVRQTSREFVNPANPNKWNGTVLPLKAKFGREIASLWILLFGERNRSFSGFRHRTTCVVILRGAIWTTKQSTDANHRP